MRSATRSGILFTALFVAAGVVSTGELAGSFADPDRVFVERFADEGNRIADIIGSYLLAFAALAFLWFAHGLAAQAPTSRLPIILGGAATAGGMFLAAALIIIVARAPGLVPRWLQVVSYPTAAIVAFTALIFFMPLFIFIAWVVTVAASHRPAAHDQAVG